MTTYPDEKQTPVSKMSIHDMMEEAREDVDVFSDELEDWMNETESNQGTHLGLKKDQLQTSLTVLRKARYDFYMNVERSG